MIADNRARLLSMSPIDRIKSQLQLMSKKQASAATYILENMETVPFYTLAELSHQSGISEATIIRLTATLGYEGFSEMQRALRDMVKDQLSMSKRMDLVEQLGANSESIMRTVMKKGVEGLQRTMCGIKSADFEKAVDLLAGAKRVFMFGSRSSYYLVEFFALELRWIRNDVYALSTQSSEFDALSDLREGDVFFAISMPHYLRSTIYATELAHEKGIPTIVITDSLSSPLIPYTTLPLIVDNEIFSYCDNIVPIVATITALLNSIGAATHPRSNAILSKKEETWDRFNLYFK